QRDNDRLIRTLRHLCDIGNTVVVVEHDEDTIRAADFLMTFTADVIPPEEIQNELKAWLEDGGRWFALHGTNSLLKLHTTPDGLHVETPRDAPVFMDLLGSQFISHPPLCDFEVEVVDTDHELTKGLSNFQTYDELYVSEVHDGNRILMQTTWGGECTGFAEADTPTRAHPVLYEREFGKGRVLYFTLGHCRGKFDMQPLMEEYPVIERCSWDQPVYYEIIERGIKWAHGRDN
ncbi:MAG: ThuA domain-containing protein, partial [Pseudomonadota bacterium]